jgi:hypothetical protein
MLPKTLVEFDKETADVFVFKRDLNQARRSTINTKETHTN